MGTVTYRDGIAILQLIIFPLILVAALFIWNRTGWRAGSKIWRYGVTLSLIRIAGSISQLLTIDHDSHDVEVAVAVCELIGLAPLLLTYIGVLRQIDIDQRLPPRFLNLVTLVCIVALILGIAGVSTANDSNDGTYHAGKIVKVSMALFLAVFAVFVVLAGWLWLQLQYSPRAFQKKLFLAVALSCPFLVVRLVYSAISDYADFSSFTVITGNPTIYLCMSVLEEIIAMALTMALGMSAVLEKDFVRYNPVKTQSGPEVREV